MSTQEKEIQFNEAMRYMENALDILRTKAKKENGYYQDKKYVRMACGNAYSGLLLAVQCYLEIKGKPIQKKGRRGVSVENYQQNLSSVDRKALDSFNAAYNVLHLDGYYEGVNKVDTIKSGLNAALEIFDKIAPRGLAGTRVN